MTRAAHTEQEIRQWLVDQLAERLRIPVDEVATDRPIISLGLDSMQSLVLVGELEDWLDHRFSMNPLLEHPTIASLASHLADRTADNPAAIP